MKPPGGDWLPLIVLAVAGSVVMAGGGFLGGYTVGYMQHTPGVVGVHPTPQPTATPSASVPATPTISPPPTPTPSPTSMATSSQAAAVDCHQFGDFPYYPGSGAVSSYPQGTRAWHVYAPAGQVASYFSNGANQLAWQFRLSSATGTQWTYRMSRAPACRGALVVMVDANGGTLYQAIPSSQ